MDLSFCINRLTFCQIICSCGYKWILLSKMDFQNGLYGVFYMREVHLEIHSIHFEGENAF